MRHFARAAAGPSNQAGAEDSGRRDGEQQHDVCPALPDQP
jgi:hypothetical protein